MRYIVNVEGAILRDGRYLMVVRGKGEAHASGVLAFVGGKVEETDPAVDVLEDTLRREIAEEVGVTVSEMAYVMNSHFVSDTGSGVVDVIFLCRYESGEPRIDDPNEVEAIVWLDASEIAAHPACPPWMPQHIERVEAARWRLGW
jgi:8-oxo-dGTP pyrophosphatase MutT (NUDIX family)